MGASTVAADHPSSYAAGVRPVVLLARTGLRRRWLALIGLAVVVALGIGAAIASLSAAWRTDHAYPEYLRRAEVADVVVNPSLLTDRIVDVIASAPGVLDVTSDSLLAVSPDDGAPRTFAEFENGYLQVRSSADGRYLRGDRPVVHAGRMIRSGAEAFLNLDAAAELGIGVGDDLPLAFWRSVPTGAFDPNEVVHPIGRTRVRVVGIGVLADEVLPDELYPRQRILVTPEVAAPFDCTPEHPSTDDGLSMEELVDQLLPAGCSHQYRYFSLRVDEGEAGVAAVTAHLSERLAEESARLPRALREADVGFFLIPTVTAEEASRVQRSLDPSVTALQAMGVAAAASTLAVVVLAGFRVARRIEPDARIWHDLGLSRPQGTAAIGVLLGLAGTVGLAGALAIGWLGSGIGPVASARAVEPGWRMGVPAAVALPVLVGSALALAGGFGLAARVASRASAATAKARTSTVAGAAARTGSVSFTLGVRAALGGGGRTGTGALLGACVAALAVVVTTLVFSTNLSSLVGTPARYGWPYDVAVVVGGGYGGADEAAIAASLDRDEVEAWGVASLAIGVSVDGDTMPAVAGQRGFDDLPVELVAGALPRGDGEIALGARSAARLGKTVGDQVSVSSLYGERSATVSGLVVLPPVGPFQSDRAGLGTGALLPEPFLGKVYAEAERAAGLAPGTIADVQGAFVAIDLADDADPEAFLAALGDEVVAWEASPESRPFVYPEPVRPAQIADVTAMRSTPGVVAALLAAALVISLALALSLAVRARRRELAVLRALGCTGRQLRATVRWQALTVMGVGLAGGIPLGVALGRSLWRAFAERLAVEATPALPGEWLLVVVVVAIGLAALVSLRPGRQAAQVAPTTALRDR